MEKKLLAVFIVIVVVWTALSLQYGPLELKSDEFALFGKVIGSLILVSAIMERVLDVFLTFLHGEMADKTSDALEVAKKEQEAAKAALKVAPTDQGAKDDLAEAEREFKKAQKERRNQRLPERPGITMSRIITSNCRRSHSPSDSSPLAASST